MTTEAKTLVPTGELSEDELTEKVGGLLADLHSNLITNEAAAAATTKAWLQHIDLDKRPIDFSWGDDLYRVILDEINTLARSATLVRYDSPSDIANEKLILRISKATGVQITYSDRKDVGGFNIQRDNMEAVNGAQRLIDRIK